jgi:hypothetical protein
MFCVRAPVDPSVYAPAVKVSVAVLFASVLADQEPPSAESKVNVDRSYVPVRSTLSPLPAFEGDFSPLGEVELLQAATMAAMQKRTAWRFVTIGGSLVREVCGSTSARPPRSAVFGTKNGDFV